MTAGATRSLVLEPGPPTGPGHRRGRRWWYAAGAALVALVAAATVLLTGDDGRDVVAPPTASPAPTPGSTSEPSPSPSGPVTVVDRSTAVWPSEGSGVRPADPVEAARGFAVDFLGFSDPVVGAFRAGDSRSGEVEVRPVGNGPVTTVLLRRLAGEETWSVLGAATAEIVVTEPAASAEIRSPVTVRGSALAFEGTVRVQVRQDGSRTPLGEGFVTGGGDRMRPFEGSVGFRDPSAAYGALVLFTASEEDGRVWTATVLRVRLGSGGAGPAACGTFQAPRPSLAAGQMEVGVFYTCDPQSRAEPSPFRVYRVAPASPGVLRAAMGALLAGPSPEERAAGLTSFFSSATAGMLRGVSLEDGHAVVDLGDLRPVVPNASSSAGSAMLLSELDATAFQFPAVSTVEYRLEGSCTAFTEWLQVGGCEPRPRR